MNPRLGIHLQWKLLSICNGYQNADNFALIVSGIRRCGKSTLLYQLLDERYQDALYLNFEDQSPRTYSYRIEQVHRKAMPDAAFRILQPHHRYGPACGITSDDPLVARQAF
ncbi:AAA family ATPase [Sphingobacterium chuzhouense]|uniref:AAA family ATPase n=2 Tax=Sphingobacterium chuzhouense TaxID=1742264 RepID=A0ABR7XR21_9SPHI|nr:AAA family ATPase [Sphingobacterium chuzhouense]MBD1421596.1 AAA family ATPase [Sphingobacterium chuzhouense]